MCSSFLVLIIHFFSAVVISHAKTITLDYSDPAILYSPNWTLPQSSSDSSSFAISASVGAYLSLVVPSGTVSAEYVGFKRPGGSAYGVCLDCVGDEGAFQVIDGHEDDVPTGGEAGQPVVLFSTIDLDPSVSHTISVYNLPDDRFKKNGEITFNSVILNTDGGSSNSSSGESGGSDGSGNSESDSPDDSGNSDDTGATNTGPIQTAGSDSGDPNETFAHHRTLTAGRGSPSETPATAVSSTVDNPDSSTTTSAPKAESSNDVDVTSTSSGSDVTATSSTSMPLASGSINNANKSDSNSDTKSQHKSTALIAVVSVLSILTVISLVVGIFFYFRRRKRAQDAPRLPDPEQDPDNNSRTPLRRPSSPTAVQGSPKTSMRQTDGPQGGIPPERPRNPFAGVSPATVPLDFHLDLEYPGDSTLMKKRMRPRTGSSFGNTLGRR